MSILIKMADELKKNPLIEIKNIEIGSPLINATIDLMESWLDIKISENLISFLRNHNGFSLTWVANENYSWKRIHEQDNFTPFGKIYIPDLETMLSAPDNREWEGYLWGEDFPEEIQDRNKKLIPFDFVDNNKTECVCMEKDNGKLNCDNLIFFKTSPGPMPFNCTLEEYIDYLYQTKGFGYWQSARISPDAGPGAFLKNYFQQVFPDQAFPDITKGMDY